MSLLSDFVKFPKLKSLPKVNESFPNPLFQKSYTFSIFFLIHPFPNLFPRFLPFPPFPFPFLLIPFSFFFAFPFPFFCAFPFPFFCFSLLRFPSLFPSHSFSLNIFSFAFLFPFPFPFPFSLFYSLFPFFLISFFPFLILFLITFPNVLKYETIYTPARNL